jgi:hypothetical protein
MKTTIEIPDALLRRAKTRAAKQGISLRQFVTEALEEKLMRSEGPARPWLKAAGKLRHLSKETARINKMIEEEFERIEPEVGQAVLPASRPPGRLS